MSSQNIVEQEAEEEEEEEDGEDKDKSHVCKNCCRKFKSREQLILHWETDHASEFEERKKRMERRRRRRKLIEEEKQVENEVQKEKEKLLKILAKLVKCTAKVAKRCGRNFNEIISKNSTPISTSNGQPAASLSFEQPRCDPDEENNGAKNSVVNSIVERPTTVIVARCDATMVTPADRIQNDNNEVMISSMDTVNELQANGDGDEVTVAMTTTTIATETRVTNTIQVISKPYAAVQPQQVSKDPKGQAKSQPIVSTTTTTFKKKRRERRNCQICGLHCQDYKSLLEHRREKHFEPLSATDRVLLNGRHGHGVNSLKKKKQPSWSPGSVNVCKYCGKILSTIHSLADHERLHTGEKPFNCKWCSEAFSSRIQLMRHTQKSHSEKLSKRTTTKTGHQKNASMRQDNHNHVRKNCDPQQMAEVTTQQVSNDLITIEVHDGTAKCVCTICKTVMDNIGLAVQHNCLRPQAGNENGGRLLEGTEVIQLDDEDCDSSGQSMAMDMTTSTTGDRGTQLESPVDPNIVSSNRHVTLSTVPFKKRRLVTPADMNVDVKNEAIQNFFANNIFASLTSTDDPNLDNSSSQRPESSSSPPPPKVILVQSGGNLTRNDELMNNMESSSEREEPARFKPGLQCSRAIKLKMGEKISNGSIIPRILNNRQIYVCSICLQPSSNSPDALSHAETHEETNNNSNGQSQAESSGSKASTLAMTSSPSTSSNGCGGDGSSSKMWTNKPPSFKSGKIIYSCGFCGRKYNWPSHLKCHIASAHGGGGNSKNFKCSKLNCNKAFNTSSELEKQEKRGQHSTSTMEKKKKRIKRKRKRQNTLNSNNQNRLAEANTEDSLYTDTSGQLYCLCNKISDGPMVCCDNDACTHGQWFHYRCVGITSDPQTHDAWYCPSCSASIIAAADAVLESRKEKTQSVKK